MSVSLEYLERCSAESGFQIAALEKVVRLGEIMAETARHPYLSKVLALKGGTGLNLCFGPPQRLSVDLDFNYIGQIDREKMLADRPQVEESIANIAQRSGYRVQRSADAFAGRKVFLIYRSVLGQEERIEIDLNFLFRMPLAGVEIRQVWQPGKLDRPKIRVIGLEELLIGKMLALFSRGAARDIWDVANFPQTATTLMATKKFRTYFIALAAILDHSLSTYTFERMKKGLTVRAINEQLIPMLTINAAPQPEILVESAWKNMAPLLMLTQNENEYLAAIQRGETRLDLLFPNDAAEAERIAQHPAILWKVHNVQQHLGRKNRRTEHHRRP